MIIRVDFRRREIPQPLERPCCQQKGNLYFCPYLNWYLREHCGFQNKRECINYRKQCGVLFNESEI